MNVDLYLYRGSSESYFAKSSTQKPKERSCFIAYSAFFQELRAKRVLYYSLKGTYLYRKLLEYIILTVMPKIGEEDWVHKDTIVIPPKSGVHKSTLFFLRWAGRRVWLLGTFGVKGLNLENTKDYFTSCPSYARDCNYEHQNAGMVRHIWDRY